MLAKLALLLSLAIQASNPKVQPREARLYARWVLREAAAQHADPWVFQAIIARETRWTPTEVRHETDGSCSVGLGQINVDCAPRIVAPLLDPRTNIRRVGAVLAHLKSSCRHDCQDLGWLRAYNPGSAAYFEAVLAAVQRYHAAMGRAFRVAS